MTLYAGDYFDLTAYAGRVNRAARTWDDLLSGRRQQVVFLNLCAPFLCQLFDVDPYDYYTDLAVMAETQLRGIGWRLENLDEDEIPLAVFLDQATVHEAIAFDLPVEYRPGSPPWGGHLLEDIAQVDGLSQPDLAHNQNLWRTKARLEQLDELVDGLPVLTSVHLHAPFTLAAQLLGAEKLFLACYEAPERVHRLLDFCLQVFDHFERVKWQFGISPEPLDEFVCWRESQRGRTRVWTSDDTASMASPGIYETFILPYNQALYGNYEIAHLHMDGDWTHLIPHVQRLQPAWCEVGGETDWAAVVEALGSDTVLQGGLLAATARDGTPADCRQAVEKALLTARGKARVALTVANEVHPGTPLENLVAIVAAARAYQHRMDDSGDGPESAEVAHET